MFTTDLYLRIAVDRVYARNVTDGRSSEQAPREPYSHPRMLVGNFIEAQAAVKAAIDEVKGSGFLKTLRVLVHPTAVVEGGITQVEERVLRELALGAGAGKVVIWVGDALDDEAVKAKLVGT